MRSRELRGEANLRLAAKPSSEPSERLAFPLGKVARSGARRSVTDEGSPPAAGLTAACTFAILRLAAEPSSEPSERLAFPFGEGGTERRSAAL